jgi:hypothetical protein
MTKDPVERLVECALRAAGVAFERDKELEPGRHSIDFYLPDHDLWIEVCQMHTPRKIEQMARVTNCVLIQGMEAARGFSALLRQRPITSVKATPARRR